MSAGATHSFFFDRDGARLYGCLHAPAAPAKRLGVVLVHPFMEERQDAHPVLRALAVACASRGLPTLRFDLKGCGDSSGEWGDATLDDWRADVIAACEVLRREGAVTDVALVGLRFGATLAGLVAREVGAARLALVHPVVSGEAYVKELLMANLAAEMVLHRKVGVTREALLARLDAGEAVNLFGYAFTAAQYRALRQVDLTRTLAGFEAPTLVVDVARTAQAREPKEFRALTDAIGATAAVVRAVEPYTLWAEGKVQVARAESVEGALLPWLEV